MTLKLPLPQENKKRREQEARLAKRKEEMARRDTLPKTKKQMRGLPPPEECVIDNLLSEIRLVKVASLVVFKSAVRATVPL